LVSARKLLRSKDGEYNWYRPKIIETQNPDRIDDTDNIETVWFAGGAVELEKGELPKHAVALHSVRRAVFFILPFVVLELIIGAASGSNFVESMTVPPWLSLVFFLNVLILIIGILVPLLIYLRATKVKRLKAPLEDAPEVRSEVVLRSAIAPVAPPINPPDPTAAQSVHTGVVEDYPIARQRYLPSVDFSNIEAWRPGDGGGQHRPQMRFKTPQISNQVANVRSQSSASVETSQPKGE